MCALYSCCIAINIFWLVQVCDVSIAAKFASTRKIGCLYDSRDHCYIGCHWSNHHYAALGCIMSYHSLKKTRGHIVNNIITMILLLSF